MPDHRVGRARRPDRAHAGEPALSCVLVWRFEVAPEHRAEFERIYAGDGDWARLFARAGGFLGTELLKDVETPDVYLTIDRWASPEAFAAFKREHAQDYAELDQACEHMTLNETEIGRFG